MSVDDDDSRSIKSSSSCSIETLISPLSSSLSNLSLSSRALPYNKDFHFFANFKEFKAPIEQITSSSQFLLEIVGSSSSRLIGGNNSKRTGDFDFPSKDQDFDSEAYDWLVDFNDEVLERFDSSIDDFKRMRQIQEEEARLPMEEDSGFQLVYGKKNKKKIGQKEVEEVEMAEEEEESKSGVKVAEKKKPKVPFHIPSITRPQDEYNILVNNSNQPFEHVWLERSADGTRSIHPLEKCSYLDFVDKNITDAEPTPPPPIESTPFKVVEEVRDLKELAAKLRAATEFSVDLEHNQYRSFQGLTCLMQISTRTEDFIVDTFKLRIHIGPYLREVFKDPAKKKVMHGANSDVIWLQRDFGIYLCNVFDTGQASKVLKLERNSLEYLLRHYCGVTANKEYQNADWRFRPLPDVMLKYAREDTHYLLYIYDLMKIQLHSMPREPEHSDDPLTEVYKRSYDVCMQLYEKELLTENSYLHIYGLQGAGFNAQQLAIVSALCEWRDITARTLDESTGYILPNKTLLDIAKQKPFTINKLRGLLKSKNPYIDRHLSTILDIIRSAAQNCAEFEVVVQQLKEARELAAGGEELAANEGSEVALTTSIDSGTVSGGISINGSSRMPLGASSLFKPPSFGFGSTVTEQGGAKAGIGLSPSAKVTGATVQVLKKPTNAFGLLLGNAGPKRKPDTDKVKLEQIRSSVNLPFHSFKGQAEQSKVVVEEPFKAIKVSQPPALVRSNAEDVIMLEDDSDEEVTCNSETKNTLVDDKDEGPAEKMDKKEDDMSLDELSTDLQKINQQLDENRKNTNEKKSQEQVKPFDYNAARTQVRFGEPKEKQQQGDKSIGNGSGLKKGNAALGKNPVDEANKEFGQGKRRQAFPASGNRSATFR